MNPWRRLLLGVLIGAGILAGCGDGGGTTPGPQVLRYRRFANAPAGQTITDVLAAAPVAGQMFVIFTTDTGDVYGTIGPGLATAATAPQRLLDLAPGTAVTADAAEVRLGRVAFVLAADNTLHAGVWTVLPTSTTQYTFGPVVEVSAGDDLPALGDVDLIAEPSFARAFLVYTTTDDPDVTADPRVQLRVVGLDGLIDGIPRPVSLAASTPGVPGEFALSTTTRWSGEILGGFVGPGGDVRILLGQQSEAGTQLGTPAVRTIAAGRLNPVEGVNVFDPVRITSHTFFPPPE
ncbi:MAG TPA: hypothetical protein VEI97_15435, partial [bacterium]|nr:hypothetical protein [bacterium]